MTVARRALQSVTMYKPDKAYNGFTMFTPMMEVPSTTWLIDMQGQFVHRWRLPGQVRMHSELLASGNLMFGLYDPESPIADLPYNGPLLHEMDWDSNIVWSYRDEYLDGHDRERMRNGNTLVQKSIEVPKDIAAKVKGGVPGTEWNGVVWGSVLQEITHEDKVVWEWISYEHLDPELDNITPGCWRFAWPGWNSIVELPDGNIMTCSYNTSNILIIDKSTGKINWRWGQGEVSYPHDPSMLDNGNILLFDNGRFHVHFWSPDCSRVIEVNPRTNQIEWEYKAENPYDFCSTVISGCQRLPNGNTLICEGTIGRLFEVTASGEMVWEYMVPFYTNHETFGRTSMTFRCLRYGPDYPGLQGKKLDPDKLELWNRLYGTGTFVPKARPSSGGIVKEVPQPRYEESKPGVAKPKPEDKVASRTKLLGY